MKKTLSLAVLAMSLISTPAFAINYSRTFTVQTTAETSEAALAEIIRSAHADCDYDSGSFDSCRLSESHQITIDATTVYEENEVRTRATASGTFQCRCQMSW